MSVLSSLTSRLAEATITGSAAILLLLLLRPFLRRWLGARAAYALWLVVMLRLLAPWMPHAEIPLFPASAPIPSAPAKVSVHAYVLDQPFTVESGKIPAVAAVHSQGVTASIAGQLAIIWLAGAVGVFAISIAGAIRAGALLRRSRSVSTESVAYRAMASLPVAIRNVRILETGELKSPALCGIFRPAILLPPGWAETLSPDQLRCVLLHEIGHHARRDVLSRWVFLFARAIHWFNPLVWLAEREMRLDQELACDEWALARAQVSGVDAECYGSALLQACKFAAASRFAGPAQATMAESQTGLALRIRRLASVKPLHWGSVLGAALLGLAMAGIGPARANPETATGGDTPQPSATPATPLTQAPAPGSEPAPPPLSASTPANSTPAAPSPSPIPESNAEVVEIEAKFVELSEGAMKAFNARYPGGDLEDDAIHVQSILDKDSYESRIGALSKIKGADLLSAPRVHTKSGQRCVIEIIREFRYPSEMEVPSDGSGIVRPTAFEMRNTGVTLEAIPTVRSDGRIDLELVPSLVNFVGFINYGTGHPPRKSLKGDALDEMMKSPSTRHIINQPIFDSRKITTNVSIYSDQTVLLGGLSHSDTQQVTDTFKRVVNGPNLQASRTYTQKVKSSLFIFVKAHLMAPQERADWMAKSSPKLIEPKPSPGAPDKSELPAAAAVPDKPGFVFSPYAPKAGWVDVRKFAPDSVIKCPYTGKFFRIP